MQHAIVEKDGYKVPLIGVPMRSVIEACDCCGTELPIREIRYTGKQFLCAKCDD